MDFVGYYTIKRMEQIHGEWWRNERKTDTLPFRDEDDKFFSSTDDVQVIINGHRYNLS